jgi:hypothetical protein
MKSLLDPHSVLTSPIRIAAGSSKSTHHSKHNSKLTTSEAHSPNVINIEKPGTANPRTQSKLLASIPSIGHVPRSVNEDIFGISVGGDGFGDGYQI